MKVFITGGTGFIGSHIVMGLHSLGYQVSILARDRTKIPAFLTMPEISIIEGDLNDTDIFARALPGHDACIHNAIHWEATVTELQLLDIRASMRLFDAAAQSGVKHLIYTSSTAVHRPFRLDMNEDARLAPSEFYGATKAATEAFLAAFSHKAEVRCNTIRPGPTIGTQAVEGAPVNSAARIRNIIALALRGEDIRVAENDGRQFIGATDLARIYSAVLHSDLNRQTYLGVSRNFTTWEAIARAVVELADSSSRVVIEDASSGESPHSFDVTRIEREFGLVFDSRAALTDHLAYLVRASKARGNE